MKVKWSVIQFLLVICVGLLVVRFQAKRNFSVVSFAPLESRATRDSPEPIDGRHEDETPIGGFPSENDAVKYFEGLPVDFRVKAVDLASKQFLCMHYRPWLSSVKLDNVAIYRKFARAEGGEVWRLLQIYYSLDGLNGFQIAFGDDGSIRYDEVEPKISNE